MRHIINFFDKNVQNWPHPLFRPRTDKWPCMPNPSRETVPFKGMGFRLNNFWKASKIKSVFSVHVCTRFLKLYAVFIKRKLNAKFLLASLKTLTVLFLNIVFESRTRISVPAFLLCHWLIFIFASMLLVDFPLHTIAIAIIKIIQ